MEWPEPREQNHKYLSDEMRHARVGWTFVATLSSGDLKIVARWQERLIQALEQVAPAAKTGTDPPQKSAGTLTELNWKRRLLALRSR